MCKLTFACSDINGILVNHASVPGPVQQNLYHEHCVQTNKQKTFEQPNGNFVKVDRSTVYAMHT